MREQLESEFKRRSVTYSNYMTYQTGINHLAANDRMDIFSWIATVDAFQHWIYTHPGHTRAERTAAWLGLMDRFGGDADWHGYDAARANLWHRQLHIFLVPFYYIEYGIAQLGALQVWANSKRDQAQALKPTNARWHSGARVPCPSYSPPPVANSSSAARPSPRWWRWCAGKLGS